MASTPPADWRPLRVMVVDDVASSRAVSAEILRERGHDVAEHENGRELLAALEGQEVDVIVMDLEMPEMGGLEATQAIRCSERQGIRSGRTFIIALTGRREQRLVCLSSGMDAFLSKPVAAPRLIDVVEMRVPGGGPPEPREGDFHGGDAAAAIDLGPALARLGGDYELLTKQMQLFLQEAPGLTTEVRAAHGEGNRARLRLACHRIKGLAASYDCHELARLAEELESEATEVQVQTLGSRLDSLLSGLADLSEELEEFLERQR